MALEGRLAVRRELEDSIAQIRLLPPGQYAAGVSAFNLLRKGTLHAATGREAPLDELLDDLEPKAEVLHFLAGLYGEKRIYRKQIAAVVTVLLQSVAWRAAIEGDQALREQLPQELLELAGVAAGPAAAEKADVASAEAAAEPAAAAEGAGAENGPASAVADAAPRAARGPEGGGASPSRPPLSGSSTASLAPRPPGGPAEAAQKEDLRAAVASALSLPPAADAGEVFAALRRAVARAGGEGGGAGGAAGGAALAALEPKDLILRFLSEVHGARRIYRKQVLQLFSSLLHCDAWLQALEADEAAFASLPQELRAAAQEAAASQQRPSEPRSCRGEAPSAAAPSSATPAEGDLEVGPGGSCGETQSTAAPSSATAATADLEVAPGDGRGEAPSTAAPSSATMAAGDLEVAPGDGRGEALSTAAPSSATAATADLEVAPGGSRGEAPSTATPSSATAAASAAGDLEVAPGEYRGEAPTSAAPSSATAAAGDLEVAPEEDPEARSQEETVLDDLEGAPRAADGDSDDVVKVPAIGVSSFDVRAAIAAAKAKAPRPTPLVRDDDAHASLLDARRQIEAVVGGAAISDEALTAFEAFRRALAKATSASSVGGQEALDAFEPKSLVFSFLVDFADRKRTHRSRITSVLTSLLGVESWRAAAEGAAPHVGVAICKLAGDTTSSPLVKVGDSMAVDLQAVAARVAGAGGIGALCLQVVAAHNLIAKGKHTCPSTYVRVSLGERIKRTAVSCHCRWDAAPPFVFEVLSLHETVRLEVLDGRLRKDELLGVLEVPVAAVPRQTGLASSRHALDGTPCAELELGLALAVVPESAVGDGAHEAALETTVGPRGDALARPVDADSPTWGGTVARIRAVASDCPAVPELLERAIQSLRAWERGGVVAAADGAGHALLCPSGHPVTKRKEGLRWHQKAEFWKQSSCDFCDEDIDPDAVRWRCHFHCNFDLCEACHTEAHATAERAGPDAALGVDSVQMPREAIEHRSEAVFFGIDVMHVQGGRPSRVMRRYKEFLSLSEKLGPKALCFANAPFPEKLFFGCWGEKLEERRQGLELWLRQVLESTASRRAWQGPVREFLSLPLADVH